MMTVYLYDEAGAPVRRPNRTDHVRLARLFPPGVGDVLHLSLLPDGTRQTFVVSDVDADGSTAFARRVRS